MLQGEKMRRNNLKSRRPGVRGQKLRTTRAQLSPSQAKIGPDINALERAFRKEVWRRAEKFSPKTPLHSKAIAIAHMLGHTSNLAIKYVEEILRRPPAEEEAPGKKRLGSLGSASRLAQMISGRVPAFV